MWEQGSSHSSLPADGSDLACHLVSSSVSAGVFQTAYHWGSTNLDLTYTRKEARRCITMPEGKEILAASSDENS
jgi:hypothetical protein